jgi:hypothetical protein
MTHVGSDTVTYLGVEWLGCCVLLLTRSLFCMYLWGEFIDLLEATAGTQLERRGSSSSALFVKEFILKQITPAPSLYSYCIHRGYVLYRESQPSFCLTPSRLPAHPAFQ